MVVGKHSQIEVAECCLKATHYETCLFKGVCLTMVSLTDDVTVHHCALFVWTFM